jgi:predicted transcriptional regulator
MHYAYLRMASRPRSMPLSLRLGEEGQRALEDIARRRGITRAEAARQAIAETADTADRAAREQLAADMDAVAADWPE